MNFNLFRNINGHLDLARLIGAKAAIVYPATISWTAYKAHTAIDPASFGTGYLAVLGGIAALISGKELALAKANQTNVQTAQLQQGQGQ